MPNFGQRLAGAWKPGVENALYSTQFNNPFAPQEVQQLGNVFQSVLNRGALQFKDDTGTVSLNPSSGQLELMGKNFGIGIGARDPSAQLLFKFGGNPVDVTPSQSVIGYGGDRYDVQSPLSPAQQLRDEAVYNYQQSNPYWYRP
jgi:hypothetical protein